MRLWYFFLYSPFSMVSCPTEWLRCTHTIEAHFFAIQVKLLLAGAAVRGCHHMKREFIRFYCVAIRIEYCNIFFFKKGTDRSCPRDIYFPTIYIVLAGNPQSYGFMCTEKRCPSSAFAFQKSFERKFVAISIDGKIEAMIKHIVFACDFLEAIWRGQKCIHLCEAGFLDG